MMQCRACGRYSPAGTGNCPFCAGRDIELFVPLREWKLQEEHRAYRIFIDRLEIDGAVYRVEGPLARGGCSVILKVSEEKGGGAFALKVPFVFDERFTNRQGNSATALRKSEKALWDEIHTFDRVESPHTLRCLYRGEVRVPSAKGMVVFPVILMELALTSLEHLVFNHAGGQNPLPMAERIKIVDDLLESLAYLHQHRLVHRDISPANIFAVRRGSRVRYIVSDYGSSRHGDDISSSRFSSSILANYLYLDPQRLRDPSFAYDPRSDIYSAGVVMAEIFAGDFWHAVAGFPVRDGEPIDFPRDVLKPYLGPRLDRRLQKIVARATASRPGRRYASVAAMRVVWDDYVHGLGNDGDASRKPATGRALEPLLLTLLTALLVMVAQPAIRFFGPPLSRFAPELSDGLPEITRWVIIGDMASLERHLKRGGYRDVPGPNGWTPLHWAIYLKRYAIARLLMDHGADWNTPSTKPLFDIPAGTPPRRMFLSSHPTLHSAATGRNSRQSSRKPEKK